MLQSAILRLTKELINMDLRQQVISKILTLDEKDLQKVIDYLTSGGRQESALNPQEPNQVELKSY